MSKKVKFIKTYQIIFILVIISAHIFSSLFINYKRIKSQIKTKHLAALKRTQNSLLENSKNYLSRFTALFAFIQFKNVFRKIISPSSDKGFKKNIQSLLKTYSLSYRDILITRGKSFRDNPKNRDKSKTRLNLNKNSFFIKKIIRFNKRHFTVRIKINPRNIFKISTKSLTQKKVKCFILTKSNALYKNFKNAKTNKALIHTLKNKNLKQLSSKKSLRFNKQKYKKLLIRKKNYFYKITRIKKYPLYVISAIDSQIIYAEINRVFIKKILKSTLPMFFVLLVISILALIFLRRIYKRLKEKNEKLQEALIQAKISGSVKMRFLAVVSHELRTPLNAILGFSELLSMEESLPEEQKEEIGYIHKSANLLSKIIEDILQMTVLESGKVEIHIKKFNVNKMIDEIKSVFSKSIKEKNIDFKIHVDETIDYLQSDENKIRQILFNLLGNAVKFTQKGEIKLSVINEKQNLIFSVKDTGTGIKKYNLDKIFQDFEQVGSITERSQGTGLGLSISRKLINLLGGRIWAQSKYGQGSTFFFSVPLIPPQETKGNV